MNATTRDEFTHIISDAGLRPRLRRELRFTPEDITNWEDRDFIAVTVKSGAEGVIVAPLERLYVVPFRLEKRKANQLGRVEAIICDICATWQRGTHSALISFPKEKGSISYLCCEDLLCSLHVRDKTAAAKLSRTQLREHNTVSERVDRLKHRLASILNNINEPHS